MHRANLLTGRHYDPAMEIPGNFPRLISLPIRTERLVLRKFEMDDLASLHSMMSRADVVRYVPWEPRDEAAVRSVLTARLNGEMPGLSFAVVLDGDDGDADRGHQLLRLPARAPDGRDRLSIPSRSPRAGFRHRVGPRGVRRGVL